MSAPRLLVLDLETSPAQVYTWSLFKPMISIDQIIEPTRVICFAAKWVGEKGVEFYSEFDFDNPQPLSTYVGGTHGDRLLMVHKAWELLDEADAVIHFNGTSFDVPHLYREFMEAGLTPPSPFHQIDLIKAAKQARWLSNKLQWVSTQIGLHGKATTGGFDLWKRCLAGDEKAWRKMRLYNKRDVTLTEQLYLELRPWIKSHPHMGLYRDPSVNSCQNCGSDDLQARGFAYTKLAAYPRFRCNNCGKWGRGARREAGVDARGVS